MAFVVRGVTMAMTAAVILTAGVLLQVSQVQSQRHLAERFEARGQLAASFSSTWVAQLLAQENSIAVDSLSGTTHLDDPLAVAADILDFREAVVLDSQGLALAAYPRRPGLIGRDLASGSRHLSAALNGRAATSRVIVSAIRGVPVIEFAVPYYTPNGRRVFSGSYEPNHTPLASYLQSVTPIPRSRVYVVDGSNKVIGSAEVRDGPGQRSTMPAALTAAFHQAADGNYDSAAGEPYFFTRQPIAGTPWALVLTAPHDTLFAPVRGPDHSVPWIVLALAALLGAGANAMMLRVLSGRDRLRSLNAALDTSARTDQLTDLPNRRHLDESLIAQLSAGGRHREPVSVLVIDLDHFKGVNDTYGHTVGDRVLEHVARVMHAAIRTEDLVGRWGGEEFLAILPRTDDPGAAQIADRLRRLVAETPYTTEAGNRRIVITLSIGCATDTSGGDKDALIHRADQALYQAKAEGRNSVRSAPPYPAPHAPESQTRLLAPNESDLVSTRHQSRTSTPQSNASAPQ